MRRILNDKCLVRLPLGTDTGAEALLSQMSDPAIECGAAI